MTLQATVRPEPERAEAQERRGRSRVLTVAVVGPAGAGKTAVLEATARQLRGRTRVAIVAIHPAADRDADRCSRYSAHVQAVKTATPSFGAISPALAKVDWANTDILFIESVGGIAGPPDLGQDVTVTVLGVTGGHDMAAEYAALLAASPVLILAQADLQRHVVFDMGAFRADVRRINPLADLIEVSAFENAGIARWLAWLDRRRQEKDPGYHPPEPPKPPPEWFFG
ncbi:MAG TPA: GTP-binding protein [Tepidisphaeraceae bacterium]